MLIYRQGSLLCFTAGEGLPSRMRASTAPNFLVAISPGVKSRASLWQQSFWVGLCVAHLPPINGRQCMINTLQCRDLFIYAVAPCSSTEDIIGNWHLHTLVAQTHQGNVTDCTESEHDQEKQPRRCSQVHQGDSAPVDILVKGSLLWWNVSSTSHFNWRWI